MYKTYANSVSEKNKCLPYSEDAFVITTLHIFYFSLKKTLLSSTMVFIRSILNELSKDKLIEELKCFDNLSEKINDPLKKWKTLLQNLIVFSKLQISKTCNSLLHKSIIGLEQSSQDNAQYLRQQMTEIFPVPLENPCTFLLVKEKT